MTIERSRFLSAGFAALLLACATGTTYSQAGFRKIVALPGIVDEKQPGVSVIADYGTFRLYRMADDVFASLSSRDRERVTVQDDIDVIQLDAYRLDTRAPVVKLPPSLTAPPRTGSALHLVQFVGPIKQQWLDELAHRGIRAVQYIESNAYLVLADAAGRQALDQLAAEGRFVQYSGPYHPYYKLGPTLREPVSQATGPDRLVPVTIQILAGDTSAATETRIAAASTSIDSDWERVLALSEHPCDAAAFPHRGDRRAARRDLDRRATPDRVERREAGPDRRRALRTRRAPARRRPATSRSSTPKGSRAIPTPIRSSACPTTAIGTGSVTNGAGDPTLTKLQDGTTTRLAFVQNCTTNALRATGSAATATSTPASSAATTCAPASPSGTPTVTSAAWASTRTAAWP